MNEIDTLHYCAGGYCGKDSVCRNKTVNAINNKCKDYPRCKLRHRKYPSPKQYQEEYGMEYPDDGAVYYQRIQNGKIVYPYERELKWDGKTYGDAKLWRDSEKTSTVNIICACTPWGSPPDNWKPE